jgi:hypothetical protein
LAKGIAVSRKCIADEVCSEFEKKSRKMLEDWALFGFSEPDEYYAAILILKMDARRSENTCHLGW